MVEKSLMKAVAAGGSGGFDFLSRPILDRRGGAYYNIG